MAATASLWRGASRQAGAMLLLAVVPAMGSWKWQATPRRSSAPSLASRPSAVEHHVKDWVEPAEAAAWGSNVLWADARSRTEFDAGHIDGALLLNEDEWDGLMPGFLERWTPGARVVVYCDGGACQASRQVAARLRDAGLAPVYVLRGGWPAWQQRPLR